MLQSPSPSPSQRGGPSYYEEYVLVRYWTCNVIGHRHYSETSAHYCMGKRKGEAAQLKRLRHRLAMLKDVREGMALTRIGQRHACSDTSVMKAIAAMLRKAYGCAEAHPYAFRGWTRADLKDIGNGPELEWYLRILREEEAKLTSLVEKSLKTA